MCLSIFKFIYKDKQQAPIEKINTTFPAYKASIKKLNYNPKEMYKSYHLPQVSC